MIADDLRNSIQIATNTTSLRELARQSGVDVARLSRFVSGQAPLTLDQAGRVAEILKLRLRTTRRRPLPSQAHEVR